MICNFSPLEVSTISLVSVTVWRYSPAIQFNSTTSQSKTKYSTKLTKNNDQNASSRNVSPIRNITSGKSSWERTKHTELGEEKQEHNDGGDEGDNTAGESTVVEILIDFGVSIQVPELIEYFIHSCNYLDLSSVSHTHKYEKSVLFKWLAGFCKR